MKPTKGIPRRDILKYGGALAAMSIGPWAPLLAQRNDPDVVIVGAGAAGLAAARKLTSLGRSFVVVEAADRIGGRAHTDTTAFGVPYDRGAHWMGDDSNPFNAYARQRGFDIYLPDIKADVYVGDRPANPFELLQFGQSVGRTTGAIQTAGEQGLDVSVASVVPQVNSWDPTTEFLLGPSLSGVQFEDLSTLDFLNTASGVDRLCSQGYGAVVADFGRDVPVELQTPVELIDWSGSGVKVHTATGIINASAVLVTVSTAVLSSGAIVFNPALPVDVQEAASRIGMGALNRVGLQFSENIFGTGPDDFVFYKTDTGAAINLVTNLAGTLVSTADVGGSLAEALSLEPDEVTMDYALGELERIFGSTVREKLVASDVANWVQNPLTLGAWSAVQPGHFSARQTLREQGAIADRVFLAGEAMHPNLYGLVAGAGLTGRHAAIQIDQVLAGGRFEPMVSAPATGERSRVARAPFERVLGLGA